MRTLSAHTDTPDELWCVQETIDFIKKNTKYPKKKKVPEPEYKSSEYDIPYCKYRNDGKKGGWYDIDNVFD
jgi:hypothetical protein